MSVPTLTLADFLLARIAEEKAAARAAWPETWQVEGNNVVTAETGLRAGYEGLRMGVAHLAMTVGKYQTEVRNATHIARWDPARVLAECEVGEADNYQQASHMRDVLRLLALPYADHEDYREEWKP